MQCLTAKMLQSARVYMSYFQAEFNRDRGKGGTEIGWGGGIKTYQEEQKRGAGEKNEVQLTMLTHTEKLIIFDDFREV